MKRYQAAIFDLDGTLLDTLDDLWDAVNHTMECFGYPHRTREEVRAFVGNGVDRLIELCIPGHEDDPNRDAAIRAYRAYYAAHSENKTKPYDGVIDAVQALLEAGVGVAVVSNKLHAATVTLCQKYFPMIPVVGGERESEGIRRKPAPDMVLRAVEELGVEVGDCVYIGDSEVDLITAANAGMDAIAVLWGFRDRAMLEENGATVYVERAEELADAVLGQ